MAAHASLYREESRWGLYHYRVDHPETNNDEWFCHVQTVKGSSGAPECFKRDIEPYIVELDDEEKDAYNKLRVASTN
jgi:succinate dehydrogenase/fumarate reductase flavoprotein subunit